MLVCLHSARRAFHTPLAAWTFAAVGLAGGGLLLAAEGASLAMAGASVVGIAFLVLALVNTYVLTIRDDALVVKTLFRSTELRRSATVLQQRTRQSRNSTFHRIHGHDGNNEVLLADVWTRRASDRLREELQRLIDA